MQEHFQALALRLLKRGGPIHQLAFRLGIDVDDLRNLEIKETLYELAKSGRHPSVTLFWLKTYSSAAASAKEDPQNEHQYPDPPIIRAIDKDGNLYG